MFADPFKYNRGSALLDHVVRTNTTHYNLGSRSRVVVTSSRDLNTALASV